jgi:integrating conjugative element protein (TIGR03758 family)
MINNTEYEAFEKGSGSTVEAVSSLFVSALTGAVFICLAVIVLGSYVAWRKGSITFEELVSYILRGFLFLIFVSGFMLIN